MEVRSEYSPAGADVSQIPNNIHDGTQFAVEKLNTMLTPPISAVRKDIINTSTSESDSPKQRQADISVSEQTAYEDEDADTDETNDENLWCEDCRKSHVGACKTHGRLIPIPDAKISRARVTVPLPLQIKELKSDSNNGVQSAVYARRVIKARSQFGPLEAPFLTDVSSGTEAGDSTCQFELKQFSSDGSHKTFDLRDEDTCNWLKFVRPAKAVSEQNLVACQYQGKIYYVSTKAISPPQELKVWYSANYAKRIGKRVLGDKEKSQLEEGLQAPVAEGSMEDEDEDDDDGDNDTGNDDGSDWEETYCGLCNNWFANMQQLYDHNCKPEKKKESEKPERKTRRKGRPRKIPVVLNIKTKSRLRKTKEKTRKGRPRKSASKVQISKPDGTRKKWQRKPKYTCSLCSDEFSAEDAFRVHVAKHTGQQAYMCEFPNCSKGFDTKFKYWRHQLVHVRPQNKHCPYCDKAFNRLDHLKTHLKTHDVNRSTFSCDKCGKTYLYQSTFDYHMALHAAKEGENSVCTLCDKSFETKEELVTHIKIHNRYKSVATLPKKQACPVCDRLFGTKKDVRRHLVVHTKDKQYLCEFCPQTFGRKDHLHRHYKSNHRTEILEQKSVEKAEFPCTICLYSFKKEKHLQHHTKTSHPDTEKMPVPEFQRKPNEMIPTSQPAAAVASAPINIPMTDIQVPTSSLNLPITPTSMVVNNHPPMSQSFKTIPYRFAPQVVSPSQGAPSPITIQTPRPIMNTVPPPMHQNYSTGQNNTIPALMSLGKDTYSDQLKARGVFTSEQQPLPHRMHQAAPWTSAVGTTEDHCYASARGKMAKYGAGPMGDMETIRFLQNLPTSHGPFPPNSLAQGSTATAMAVAWDAISDFVAVQPNITELGGNTMVPPGGHGHSHTANNMGPNGQLHQQPH